MEVRQQVYAHFWKFSCGAGYMLGLLELIPFPRDAKARTIMREVEKSRMRENAEVRESERTRRRECEDILDTNQTRLKLSLKNSRERLC
jgi:hypothetical protein